MKPTTSTVRPSVASPVAPPAASVNPSPVVLTLKGAKNGFAEYTGVGRGTVYFPIACFRNAPPTTIDLPALDLAPAKVPAAKMTAEEREAAKVAAKAKRAAETPADKAKRAADVAAKAVARAAKLAAVAGAPATV